LIIAAHAGCGKTTLAAMHPDKVIDFVAMPYKYYLDDDFDEGKSEGAKANFDNVMREDWPWNYVRAIKEVLGDGKVIVIPSDFRVLLLLGGEGIPYTLCYPAREAKEVYRQRYFDRGNSEEFLDIFIGGWDNFLDLLESDPSSNHVVMQPHQFLADVIEIKN